jgi:UDP-glucose:(heptosyl)LPS alpha-1,3-glucosyltransferase
MGHDVHIVAQRILQQDQAGTGHTILSSHISNGLDKLLFRFHADMVIATLSADVINSFGVGRTASVVTAQSCHRAGVEIMRNLRHHRFTRRNFGFYDSVSLRDERALLTSPHTRRIIAVSELVKQQIVMFYNVDPDLIAVVPNGIDYDLFAGLAARAVKSNLRSRLHLASDDFVLLFVGNEFDRKGLQTIIESLAILRDPALRLVVVGGDNAAPYKRYAMDRGILGHIHFAGRIQGPEEYFVAADALVLPTVYEPFGIVIAEAMAAGIPVLTTRAAGAVEGLEHGTHGLYLQDPLSAEELATSITTIKNDSTLRKRVTSQAQLQAQRFSWERIAAQTLRIYNEVTSEGRCSS